MILKSTRIPVGRTRKIARYLAEQADNEAIRWLRGDVEEIELMGQTANSMGRTFGVRHIIVAPEIALVGRELMDVMRAIQNEYRVSDLALGQACIVEHRKVRRGQGRAAPHFHLALPELDLQTGKVMDSRFTRIRDEKLSRFLELRLEHPMTPGRFNVQIYGALQNEVPDLDLFPFQQALFDSSEMSGMVTGDGCPVRLVSLEPRRDITSEQIGGDESYCRNAFG